MPTKKPATRKSARKTAKKAPEAPKSFGQVAPETQQTLAAIRGRTDLLLAEIGRIEFRKGRILREIESLDSNAAQLLKTEATRLGIPEGAAWRMTPEGEALPS
jgi:hypothetical protein